MVPTVYQSIIYGDDSICESNGGFIRVAIDLKQRFDSETCARTRSRSCWVVLMFAKRAVLSEPVSISYCHVELQIQCGPLRCADTG